MADNVLGFESDGTSFNCATDGRTIVGPVANMGTPANFTILGTAPVSREGTDRGFATMGIYTLPSGGAVFSANTMGWPTAIGNPQVAQVTRNVLDRFIAGQIPAEPEIRSEMAYFFIDRFNCDNLDHEGVLSSYSGPAWYKGVPSHNYVDWSGDPKNVRYSRSCGIAGGAGLELTIDHADRFRYQSQIRPNWQATNVLHTRVFLNLAQLTMADGDSFQLVKHLHADGQSVTGYANVIIRQSGGQYSVRYTDNQTGKGPAWITVPADRPFLLETRWDKPRNLMSLWVDGKGSEYQHDLSAHPPLNRVDLLLNSLDAGTTGKICLDELAFADWHIGLGIENAVYVPLAAR